VQLASLSLLAWMALGLGALLAGFAKTAISGVVMITVALFAAVLPTRESTGTLLLLLLVGDVVAVSAYRRDVEWRTLARLAPSVVVGVLAGVAFVLLATDQVLRRTIGVVILVLLAVHVWRRRRAEDVAPSTPGRAVTTGAGALAGFTSMVANVGGSVMAVYLLGARLEMRAFLGTGAWFFFAVNLFKLPFMVALGLVSGSSLVILVVMAPLVLIGTYVGRRVIDRIERALFEKLVLGFTFLAALNLLR
jgi:uncharacterized membrane protein YfcA